MRQAPFSFGSVLFDELEQVAVRRGGFASLLSLREEVLEAKGRVEASAAVAADPAGAPRSVREESDRAARDSEELLGRVAEAAGAVNELGEVVRARCETAERVLEKVGPPREPPGRPVAFASLLGVYRAVAGLMQIRRDPRRVLDRRDEIKSQVEELSEHLRAVQGELDRRGGGQDPLARAQEAGERFEGNCRLARGLNGRFEDLHGDDYRAAAEARRFLDRANGRAFDDRGAGEQLLRAAVLQRAAVLASALEEAAGQLERIRKAYLTIVGVSQGIAAQVRLLIDAQPDALRYEIFDILEDGARGEAMRMETVGLAFSGGGIRSATFNLGFLQGMASLGLLKRFDYLSTVSGGGYIGAWLAAWIRREGGPPGEPRPPSDADVEREARPLIDERQQGLRDAPPEPPQDLVDRWIAARSGEIRAEVRAKLEARHRARVQEDGSRPAEGRPAPPAPPDADDVDKVADPLITQEKKKIRKGARKRHLEEQLEAAQASTKAEVRDRLRAEYEAELRSKRRRTARALENVESELDSSRAVQARAMRRWVTPGEVDQGREDAMSPPPPLRRIVEEEPQPIHHLRSYSNYLAPRLGALSIDTWTMISVYLRNLLLNQFILLPMMLAAIVMPRLLLLLFASRIDGPSLSIVRGWAELYPGWPVVTLFGVAFVAMLTVFKLVDFFGQKLLRKIESREPRNVGRALLALLILGLAALVRDTSEQALLPAAMRAWGTDDPGRLPAVVPWLAARPWAPALAVLLPALAALAAWPRRLDDLAAWLASKLNPRVQAWTMMALVALDTISLLGQAAPRLLDVLEAVPARLPPWLLAASALLALPSALRYGAARPTEAAGAGPMRITARGVCLTAAALAAIAFVASIARWLTGEAIVFAVTMAAAALGFHRTYRTVALIRESRRPAPLAHRGGARFDLPIPILWEQILIPFAVVALGVSLLFTRPGKPYFVCPIPGVGAAFDPAWWGGSTLAAAAGFGAMVGVLRLLSFGLIDLWDRSRDWDGFQRAGAAAAAFASGLVPGTAVAAVMMAMGRWLGSHPGELQAVMMSFGPLLIMAAMGAGSAIEVGLIGGYQAEDMREWRASLGAYLLLIGLLWGAFSALSVFGPLLIWQVGTAAAAAAGLGWVITSISGAMAGRSAQTDGRKGGRRPLEYVALAAPAVFLVGLIVSIAMLATVLQGIAIPVDPGDASAGPEFLGQLARAGAGWTWAVLLVSGWVATIGCVYVNINLFSLNAFYANRLVRCYLGASRPREAPAEGRPTFAPTNCPVPVRRPNPITGFDPTDDFPMHDLAIVRGWEADDLVVDYRGPYHLVNTAMNLVAGSELAWQERMAESFVISPLHCGSKTTGYRPTRVAKGGLDIDELEADEVNRPDDEDLPGFGGDVRLGTAVSVSGAAASPNAGYHSSPLVTILMTVLNARLGLWFGNPARDAWRRSGPGFAIYLVNELFGRTTSKGDYVYLSDGGHFENLGVYELIRRRCRHIVLCDAGADPELSFWDLGSLVRKSREDFGVRIEIDVSPLLKREGGTHSRWHCAVGRIHYEDVDPEAAPGTLFYVKPSLTGDEPSDVRNYVVDHPSFPHESTADQFFSESQFESYRVLGEHAAAQVFGKVVHEAGPAAPSGSLFSQLRRRWFPPPPDLDKNFLESAKAFVEIHRDLRGDARLEGISRDLYDSELKQLGEDRADRAAELHAVIQMLQAMENAWVGVNLEAFSDHPLNRGWMNVFRRWTSSRALQRHWPAIRGEFSEGFVRFCESELNLAVPDPFVLWLDGRHDAPADRRIAAFESAIGRLNKEFELEWPHMIVREVADGDCTLMDMFRYALRFPAPPAGAPRVALIVPGRRGRDGEPPLGDGQRGEARRDDGATAEPPHYGVILAWESGDGAIDLVVWIRGAYRTLGLGGAIAGAIESLKEELRGAYPDGYTLRSRYPADDRGRGVPRWQGRTGEERGRGKQRWQSHLWSEFFRGCGFHSVEGEQPMEDMCTLYYHYEPI